MFRSLSPLKRVIRLHDFQLLKGMLRLMSYPCNRTTKRKAPIVSTFGAFFLLLYYIHGYPETYSTGV